MGVFTPCFTILKALCEAPNTRMTTIGLKTLVASNEYDPAMTHLLAQGWITLFYNPQVCDGYAVTSDGLNVYRDFVLSPTPTKSGLDDGEASLIKWQFHEHGSYFTTLWECLTHADSTNLDLLARAYPLHVNALNRFRADSDYWHNLQRRAVVAGLIAADRIL